MIVKTSGSQMGSPAVAEEGGEVMGGGRGKSGESSEVHERPSVTSTAPKARSRSRGVATLDEAPGLWLVWISDLLDNIAFLDLVICLNFYTAFSIRTDLKSSTLEGQRFALSNGLIWTQREKFKKPGLSGRFWNVIFVGFQILVKRTSDSIVTWEYPPPKLVPPITYLVRSTLRGKGCERSEQPLFERTSVIQSMSETRDRPRGFSQ